MTGTFNCHRQEDVRITFSWRYYKIYKRVGRVLFISFFSSFFLLLSCICAHVRCYKWTRDHCVFVIIKSSSDLETVYRSEKKKIRSFLYKRLFISTSDIISQHQLNYSNQNVTLYYEEVTLTVDDISTNISALYFW